MLSGMSLKTKCCATILAVLLPFSASYAFSDNEARRAILDLREKVEAQRQATEATLNAQTNSLLALSNQIELLRNEVAVLRGRVEQLERTASDLSSQSAPREVTVDGKTFNATPQEIGDYEAGIERLRSGDYAGAVNLFQNFLARWPKSGYIDSAYFWLGNAQYGNAQYKEAIESFTHLINNAPNHLRAPDALLSIANCYVALKNTKSVRSTLERLVQDYPQSDAATQARSRLGQM